MAKSNFEKVESVVSWVRDKKITGYRISKETNAREMSIIALAQGRAKVKNISFETALGLIDFYDKKGKFKGTEAMIAELEKLNIIKEKFGEQSALLVAKELFGEEAGRPAMMLAQQGIKGFNAAMADMAQQADANARIAEKTSTLSAAFEQLGGVAGMLSGMIGETLRESLLWFAQTAQDFLGDTLQPWLKEHKTLVKWVMIGATAFAVLAGVSGVALLAFAGFNAALVAGSKILFGSIGFISTLGSLLSRLAIGAGRWAWIIGGKLFSALRLFAVFAGGFAKMALTTLGNVVLWLGRAFLLAR